jgi:DNA-binding response OmpR family regulator
MPKILIVDDEADIREFAKRFFTKRHIDVLTASGGVEAIKLIFDQKPDLVLLDIHMEGMSGLEVLRRLRENKNNVKVLMVTGAEEESVISEANNWDIRGYIHKPLILEELEQIVMKELGTANA